MAAPARPEDGAVNCTGTGASPYVLVADGQSSRREHIATLLTAAGYRIESVADGASAMASIARRAPNGMICAARLPLMSGPDLITYVRSASGFASLPVIGVHADSEPACREPLIAAGATDVVTDAVIELLLVPLLRAAFARNTLFTPGDAIMRARLPHREQTRLASLRRTG